MVEFNVLAIDLNASDAPAQFVKSLHETGFAVIHGHPIGEGAISDMYSAWGDFFASDSRFDHAARPGEMHGYYGFKSENAKDSPHKDLKEFYHVYQNAPVPGAVEAQTREFHSNLLEIGSRLLGWLDEHSPSEVGEKFSEPLTGMIEESEQNLLRILQSCL